MRKIPCATVIGYPPAAGGGRRVTRRGGLDLVTLGEVAHHHPGAKLSPKRPRVETSGLSDLFPYYAGFSFEWAFERIASCADQNQSVVLDSWNGSGTTSHAASVAGVTCIGVDLNPVAAALARLRSARKVAARVKPPRSRPRPEALRDPLDMWFDDDTAWRIREWREAGQNASQASSNLCTVALFTIVKRLSKAFEGSNPTWVRKARNDAQRVGCSELDVLVEEEQQKMALRLQENVETVLKSPLIVRSSAGELPLPAGCVDLTVSSPPYLTRIDYGVAYSRELAVLGSDIFSDRRLRSSLTGTTLIRSVDLGDAELGPEAVELVRAISKHASKDSNGYYRKQLVQYLFDLDRGISEICRVSRNSALATLVVQDSYYKDIPVNLAQICVEQFQLNGWTLEGVDRFPVRRLLTTMNTAARGYTKGSVDESVITMRKSQR